MPGPLPKYAINLTAEQAMPLHQLSACATAPFAVVQRARILLLAHQQPTWRHAAIARHVGCCVNTVKRWRQRWQTTTSRQDAPRPGCTRTFTPLQRAPCVWQAVAALVGREAGAGRCRATDGDTDRAGDHPPVAPPGPDHTLALSRVAACHRSAVCGQGRPGARSLRTRADVGSAGRSGGVQ